MSIFHGSFQNKANLKTCYSRRTSVVLNDCINPNGQTLFNRTGGRWIGWRTSLGPRIGRIHWWHSGRVTPTLKHERMAAGGPDFLGWESSSVWGAVEVAGGRQADVAAGDAREPGEIRETPESRPQLLPDLRHSGQFALVLLKSKYTKDTFVLGDGTISSSLYFYTIQLSGIHWIFLTVLAQMFSSHLFTKRSNSILYMLKSLKRILWMHFHFSGLSSWIRVYFKYYLCLIDSS